jgi:hypothetical protein
MSAVRSSLQKQKALEWLIDRAEIVDPDGTVIDRAALETPDEESAAETDTEASTADASDPTSADESTE